MEKVPKFKNLKERIDFYFEDVSTLPGMLTDVFIVILILIFTIIFVILSTNISESLRNILVRIDAGIMIIFSAEYLLRFWVAEKKIKHFFNIYSIVDLIAILPFYLGAAESGIIRIFRVFRILRLVRFMRRRYLSARIKNVDLYILAKIMFTIFAIIFVSSGLIFSIEHKVNPERFSTFFDAVYYSVVTLTTVGFGDITPVSTAGRLVTMIMILSGIIFIPWQIGMFLRRLVHTAGKIKVICKKCGLHYHDPDSTHCRTCGNIIYIPKREKYL